MNATPRHPPAAKGRRTTTPLVLILLISLAPVVLALLAYYAPALGLRPSGTTNYGTLINPQRSIPAAAELPLTTLDGQRLDLQSLQGQWLLLSADRAACPESCVRKLFILRNSHASQGKEVRRLRRVWFVLDENDIDPTILEAYEGTVIVRTQANALARFLAPEADGPDPSEALEASMWIIDPLGHLMMRYPADAEPVKVRDDIRKLLRQSRVG